MDWNQVVQKVMNYIVHIYTPDGSGTGFLCLYNQTKAFCGIATALHVVEQADNWQQPIRLVHYLSNKPHFLKEDDRIIFTNRETDSAVIFFPKPEVPFPDELIPLLPINKPLSIGNEVGWLGFPAIDPNTLCFFSGNVSARQETRNAYLIDGVAIHGVSGGPVIYISDTDGVQFVGIVSQYRANRVTGEALPGLLYAQDVSHFHSVLKTVESFDEARKKKQEAVQLSAP
ncbi:Uncharacterised protein [uncultured archaeon]|nr:Uncharacterised protein [uncultured archaeon]